jgi:hypothetical protein
MQYFIKNITVSHTILADAFQLCGLTLDTGVMWRSDNIQCTDISAFNHLLRPLYRPCFAVRFLDPCLAAQEPLSCTGAAQQQAALLTVLKQLITAEGTYELVKQEKYKKHIGKKMTYYLQRKVYTLAPTEEIEVTMD